MTQEPPTTYLDFLGVVASQDVDALLEAHKSYGNSCLKRGGVGLFMMFARKWDRLENQVLKFGYDIMKTYEKDTRKEGILDDVRDLRRYLMILEAELMVEYHNDFPEENALVNSLPDKLMLPPRRTLTPDDRQGVVLEAPEGAATAAYVNQDRAPVINHFPHVTTTLVQEKVGERYALFETDAVDGKAERFWDTFWHTLTVVATSDELPPGEKTLQRYTVKKAS